VKRWAPAEAPGGDPGEDPGAMPGCMNFLRDLGRPIIGRGPTRAGFLVGRRIIIGVW
jgi:hypothetical protein